MKTQEQINIFDVAQYLIKHQNKNDFTRLKVIKLTFFVYCKYLVDFKKPLFKNDFEAWTYGPVSPKLFFKLIHETKLLSNKKIIVKNFNEEKFNKSQKNILDYILQKYGLFTAGKLVDLTHKDFSPWSLSYWCKDWTLNNISDKKILDYYSQSENKI